MKTLWVVTLLGNEYGNRVVYCQTPKELAFRVKRNKAGTSQEIVRVQRFMHLVESSIAQMTAVSEGKGK